MRRLALIPLLAVLSLAGCAQAAQVAGDALGIDVAEICATADDAYDQYSALIDSGNATEAEIAAARDDLVATLETLAEDVGGSAGDMIADGADRLASARDLTSPDAIQAVEDAHDALGSICA
ncbi:hypothetical protein [Microbacterium excoecariae]|uniref:hypothetical protein n=1 Tax=Microbacterium excoecariae TaxID=2715210 RepID=UPI00140D4A7F|nr:hypothetical protein [Microbacterium excoecariae]NHI16695.1 hypothetical protein [Microbacterium excoecariae]